MQLVIDLFQRRLIRSQQNFAHTKTAVLSWYVQNFVALGMKVKELQTKLFQRIWIFIEMSWVGHLALTVQSDCSINISFSRVYFCSSHRLLHSPSLVAQRLFVDKLEVLPVDHCYWCCDWLIWEGGGGLNTIAMNCYGFWIICIISWTHITLKIFQRQGQSPAQHPAISTISVGN